MTRDEELAQISEIRKEYKSMPSFTGSYSWLGFYRSEPNRAKTELYHMIEMKMKTLDMKDKYR
jgi:hypothetical protein